MTTSRKACGVGLRAGRENLPNDLLAEGPSRTLEGPSPRSSAADPGTDYADWIVRRPRAASGFALSVAVAAVLAATVMVASAAAPVVDSREGLTDRLPGGDPAAIESVTAGARPGPRGVTAAQDRTYTLYVCAESDDIVEKIAFGPGGFRSVRSIPVGAWPTETEGPHGIAVSSDGRYWFVSMAHGQPGPYGKLYKFDTETDTLIGETELGLFPATLSMSRSIGLLYVVNFNLHGLPEPSDISVVDPESMTEVGRIPTGVMPHGARMNREGSKLYSVNMMDDTLVEVDAYRMEIARWLALSEHGEHRLAGGSEAGHAMMSDAGGAPTIKPTWATPPTPAGKIYVAGNGAARILEIDLEEWAITRTFETGRGPYNLDTSPDGTLLAATYKGDKAVGFWNLETGTEAARVATLRPIPHGIVISPDGRYAFASIEGIGGEPGSVEAYDLETFERVGNIDIAKQAGGIAIWKVE